VEQKETPRGLGKKRALIRRLYHTVSKKRLVKETNKQWLVRRKKKSVPMRLKLGSKSRGDNKGREKGPVLKKGREGSDFIRSGAQTAFSIFS